MKLIKPLFDMKPRSSSTVRARPENLLAPLLGSKSNFLGVFINFKYLIWINVVNYCFSFRNQMLDIEEGIF